MRPSSSRSAVTVLSPTAVLSSVSPSRSQSGQNGVHCLAQGQRFGVDRVLAGAQLSQLKQAVDQGFQVGLPGVDSLQIALAGSFIGG